MNQANDKVNQAEVEKTQHVRNIARALSKLNLKFNVPIREFVEIYREELLKEARKQNPTQNTVEIALATGITRQKITSIESEPEKKTISTKEVAVMEKLSEHFESSSTNTMPLRGQIPSFKNIVDSLYHGHESYMAMANNLVKKGCIKIRNKQIEYISKKVIYTTDPNKFLLVAGREINSLVTCIIDNYKTGESGTKKPQYAWWSEQIPPHEFVKVKEHIETNLKKTHSVIDDYLVELENKNCLPNGQKHPLKSFPRIGLGIYFISPEYGVL